MIWHDGFLGYSASFMLDVVVCAMAIILPLLVLSIYLVKVRRSFRTHRNLQIALGAILLVAVGLFEIDMRLQGGIDNILAKRSSPLSPTDRATFGVLLKTHLVFAVSTPFLWGFTLVRALRQFGRDPRPGPHSRQHKVLGWVSAADLALTSVTGLLVYYWGFVR